MDQITGLLMGCGLLVGFGWGLNVGKRSAIATAMEGELLAEVKMRRMAAKVSQQIDTDIENEVAPTRS